MGSILLPMPKATDVNGVEWGKSELTISGLAAVGLTDKLTGGGRLAGKSAEEAQNDINDPNTDTVKDDITRSVKIKVAKMPSLGAASDKDDE